MAERLPVAKTYKLYVGGAFARSESGRHVTAEDHQGNHVANSPRGTRKDVRDAVKAARGALPGWQGRTAYNRGQILYRGEPVSGGLVVFAPDPERGSDGPLATTTLKDDGSFTLTGDDGKPVPPGWYRVAVAPRAGTVPLPTADQPYPGLPGRFRNPALSGLEVEVKAGAENVFCFDLDDS